MVEDSGSGRFVISGANYSIQSSPIDSAVAFCSHSHTQVKVQSMAQLRVAQATPTVPVKGRGRVPPKQPLHAPSPAAIALLHGICICVCILLNIGIRKGRGLVTNRRVELDSKDETPEPPLIDAVTAARV